MQKFMKQGSRVFALVLIVTFGAWVLWTQNRSTIGSVVEQVNEPGIEEVVSEDIGDQTQSTTAQPSVERSRKEPFTHASGAKEVLDHSLVDENQDQVRFWSDRIDSALSGSTEDAFEFAQYAHDCSQVSRNEESLQRYIDLYAKVPILALRVSDGMMGLVEFDSFENWSAVQRQRFDNCRQTKELFTDNLRTRLEKQAQNGNAIARYMYAMWQFTGHPGITDNLFKRLNYENLALEFTRRNIDENNPLGLLALGFSYKAGGVFTPFNAVTGKAMLIAAGKCDPSNLLVDSILNRMSYDWSGNSSAASEAIVQAFCN